MLTNRRFGFVLAGLCWIYSLGALAAPATPDNKAIPDALKPWVPWVLADAQDVNCPHAFNDGQERPCVWPATLQLKLGPRGGQFEQTVSVFKPSWVALPGNARFWPQELRVDGKPVPVTGRDGVPGVSLPVGEHRLAGTFSWVEMPETLQVPAETGLLQLVLGGKEVLPYKLDADGQLWLQTDESKTQSDAQALEVQVSRLLVDSIPFQVVTHLDITVSGKNREVLLPPSLLPGMRALSISSTLPARLEADGRLRLQLRPGRWSVDVAAQKSAVTTALTLPSTDAPLAAEETWVFQAQSDLRVVSPTGLGAVDSKLVNMPDAWRSFPAFVAKPGETLQLVESKRGDPLPAPDKLNLHRRVWLDFDGGGYTVRDSIAGSVSRNWRLSMAAPAVLGHVALDGEDQFITTLGASSGVELRQGRANVLADSRIASDTRVLGASGWQQDFEQVVTELNLPLGWSLFAASGTDSAAGSWVSRWSLLDFFTVLIIALACRQLWGWRAGSLALVTMVLTYPEAGAPRWLWLLAIGAVALIKVMPLTGRLQQAGQALRWGLVLALVAVLVPFVSGQIHKGLYAVLDGGVSAPPQFRLAQDAPATAPAPAPAPAAEAVADTSPYISVPPPPPPPPAKQDESYRELRKVKKAIPVLELSKSVVSYQPVRQTDPNAVVQTGPGLPEWSWKSYQLSWNGPVDASQTVHLWLIPPWLNTLLAFLRVALVALLLLRVLDRPPGAWGGWMDRIVKRFPGIRMPSKVPQAAVLACLLLAGLASAPDAAQAADIPDAAMRQELRDRLTKPAECLPQCADIATMQLQAQAQQLIVRLEVHAEVATAIPLPSAGAAWQLQTVLLDGKPARSLRREDGQSWLALEAGVHQLLMQGAVGHAENVQISLPLKPHHVSANVQGWALSGVAQDGQIDSTLQLTRTDTTPTNAAAFKSTDLQTFVRVERTLVLGLKWQVHTRVERIAPLNLPLQVAIPLLPGESITGSEPRVENGMAQISMAPQVGELSWDSALKEQSPLTLTAAKLDSLVEIWRLDASSQWHVEMSGIPVIAHQDANQHRLPGWRPWPGEQVSLQISKPLGAAGQTVTLDKAKLDFTPGEHASKATLQLRLRSSRGGLHSITLPADAQLQTVKVNGQELALRLDKTKLTLPLQQGTQDIVVDWRQSGGMALWTQTPVVDLGLAGVNAMVTVHMPNDRWTLLLGGPRMGPAVLHWGAALLVLLLAWGLSRWDGTPLSTLQWFLLGLGLTQAPMAAAAVVAGWLLLLAWRTRSPLQSVRGFQGVQLLVVLWTVFALSLLFKLIVEGLLGFPDMQIVGNGSSNAEFLWYQDRFTAALPQPWVLSVPLIVYRVLMLLWALWLAQAVLKWLKWAWQAFGTGGYWKREEIQPTPSAQTPDGDLNKHRLP